MTKLARECSNAGHFTIVTMHWGEELSKKPQLYQSRIARQLIDAGADAVIGHHPHVLQPIEMYAGHPIIYSIGNFAFGSRPLINKQEGMAVAFHLSANNSHVKMVLTPLNVNNTHVAFKPRPLEEGEIDPVAAMLPSNHKCEWNKKERQWTCLLKKDQS
jgi:poly-gamma-glutamate synthesis protein (capsule biosynthesis protein)